MKMKWVGHSNPECPLIRKKENIPASSAWKVKWRKNDEDRNYKKKNENHFTDTCHFRISVWPERQKNIDAWNISVWSPPSDRFAS